MLPAENRVRHGSRLENRDISSNPFLKWNRAILFQERKVRDSNWQKKATASLKRKFLTRLTDDLEFPDQEGVGGKANLGHSREMSTTNLNKKGLS